MNFLAHLIADKGIIESKSAAKHFINKVNDLESVSDLDYEFVITKSDLGRLEIGRFWYNHHYQYDFTSKTGKAYRIKIGSVECVEFSIRQRMSDYADDFGSVQVKFRTLDGAHEILIPGGACVTAEFIGAIVDFMKDFNQNYSANWQYYFKVKELEKANESLTKQVEDLEQQIQVLTPTKSN